MQPVIEVPGPLAFDDLYERDYRPLVSFAFALCGSWSGAEDLAQDAFVAMYRDWDRLGAYDAPEAWLRRAVANRATSRWRRVVSETKALARLGSRRERAEAAAPEVDDGFWAAGEVELRGGTGLLRSQPTGAASGGPLLAVLWEETPGVFGVVGGDVGEDALLAVAESLRHPTDQEWADLQALGDAGLESPALDR